MNGGGGDLDKPELRAIIREQRDEIVARLNRTLAGEGLRQLEPTLARVGRGGRVPHWFGQLEADGSLPNLDGKTVGSIIEMLLVGVLETTVFSERDTPPLRINPAQGVDLPDLDLGVKCPSENFCTSEPFFSPYERLNGNEYDALILLTDYQTAKNDPPLRLSIIDSIYLRGTQLADHGLCTIARALRPWLLEESEGWARRTFRFLAFVNQGDWRGRQLLSLVGALRDADGEPNHQELERILHAAEENFRATNERRDARGNPPLPDTDLERLAEAVAAEPPELGVISAADDWVEETHRDFARSPNENEWTRLKEGPLDGQIGMSYALQWRYNFGRVFRT